MVRNMDDMHNKLALNAALKYLAIRDRTTAQVREHLRKQEHPEESIEYAVERLTFRKILDDARFASNWIAERARKGYGEERIARELAGKGIGSEQSGDIEAAGSSDSAQKLAERYIRRYGTDINTKRKAYAALRRRGFTNEQAKAAINKAIFCLECN
ncbi:hypothetical protein FACS18948_7250 [Clostridia bacterium]|nr:hypothetical protein FACS18948_7250 [Clostridia bacterium]